jgi:NADH-quinone oxidoreductase subunit M
MFAMLSSIGLPGLNGFVGEFLIMLGSYVHSSPAVAFAVTGVILGALYMLWMYERMMFGPITHKINETIRDLSGREIATMVPLMVLMVVMGLYPRFIIDKMEPSVALVLQRVQSAQARIDHDKHAAHFAQNNLTPSPSPSRTGESERSVILSEAKELRAAISAPRGALTSPTTHIALMSPVNQ